MALILSSTELDIIDTVSDYSISSLANYETDKTSQIGDISQSFSHPLFVLWVLLSNVQPINKFMLICIWGRIFIFFFLRNKM